MIRIITYAFAWRVLQKVSNQLYIKLRYLQFLDIKRRVNKIYSRIPSKSSSFNLDTSLLIKGNNSVSDKSIDNILKGNFHLLGAKLGSMPPHWHIDGHSGKKWEIDFHENIKPFSTINDRWDKKIPWEKSRLQFLIPLSRKYLINKDKKILIAIENILSDWIDKNPPFYGINWANSMEVGVRAINIIFCIQLLSEVLNKELFSKINKSLLYHLFYIEVNPEIDFKINKGFINTVRNNHFIFGCTGALYVSTYFNYSNKMTKYISLLENELDFQFYDDGGNFEHSIPYHYFTFEAFVMVAFLHKIKKISINNKFLKSIENIAIFTKSIIKPNGSIPKFGDNDSGCIVWHYDSPNLSIKYHLLDLAATVLDNDDLYCSTSSPSDSWLCKILKKKKSILDNDNLNNKDFLNKDFGIVISKTDRNYLAIYLGPQENRNLTAGHAHNDCMSFELSINNNVVFTNKGTLTYADINNRNKARESSSHNVCVIDNHEINGIKIDTPFYLDYTTDSVINSYEESGGNLNISFSHNGFRSVGIKKYCRSFNYNNNNGDCTITDILESNNQHNIQWYFHTPSSDVILQDDRIIITIQNKKYYLRTENSFDNISITSTLLWPEYGVKEKGCLICYSVNNVIQKNSFNFKIGSIN